MTSFTTAGAAIIGKGLVVNSSTRRTRGVASVSTLTSLGRIANGVIVHGDCGNTSLAKLSGVISTKNLRMNSASITSGTARLRVVSVGTLRALSKSVSMCGSRIACILFRGLTAVRKDIVFGTSSLRDFRFPILAAMNRSLGLRKLGRRGATTNSVTSLRVPRLADIKKILSMGGLTGLASVDFLGLGRANNLSFRAIPIVLRAVGLPRVRAMGKDVVVRTGVRTPPANDFIPRQGSILRTFNKVSGLAAVGKRVGVGGFATLGRLPS